MRPLRVAHVLSVLAYGGVESMTLRLMRSLPADRFAHVLVTMEQDPGERAPEFAALGVERHDCPLEPGRRLRWVRRLARLLARLAPDRVLAYHFGNHLLIAAAAKMAGVPATWVRVAGSPLRDCRTRLASTVRAQLARPLCRGEIAVSGSVGRQLVRGIGLPGRRVHVIANGCPVDEIERRAGAARAAREVGPPRVLMVSRMDDAKDHESLLAAFRLLADEGSTAQLVLVGDGPRRALHEARAADLGIGERVLFLGSRSDVPEEMGRASVLVLATRTEGMPNVLLEGMAARVPVVATDIEPCREALDGGRCGRLVRPGDPADLARAVRGALASPGAFVEEAARRVRDVYDIRRTVEAYAELLAAGPRR